MFTDEVQVSDGRSYPLLGGVVGTATAGQVSGGVPDTLLAGNNTLGNRWTLSYPTASAPTILGAFAEEAEITAAASFQGLAWNMEQEGNYTISCQIPEASFFPAGSFFVLALNMQGPPPLLLATQNNYQLEAICTTEGTEATALYEVKIQKVVTGAVTDLVKVAGVKYSELSEVAFTNYEGRLIAYSGPSKKIICESTDYQFGHGYAGFGFGSLRVKARIRFLRVGQQNKSTNGRTAVQRKTVWTPNKEGGLPVIYSLPSAFLSRFELEPKLGTTLKLEELRAEVNLLETVIGSEPARTVGELQKWAGQLGMRIGPVNAVILKDASRYGLASQALYGSYPGGIYLPQFRGNAVIENLEMIPARTRTLKLTEHGAELATYVEEDPVYAGTLSKIFNPAITINGGTILNFGLEFAPVNFINPAAFPILSSYAQFLEVRFTARYQIIELGKQDSG